MWPATDSHTLVPYSTLFRSSYGPREHDVAGGQLDPEAPQPVGQPSDGVGRVAEGGSPGAPCAVSARASQLEVERREVAFEPVARSEEHTSELQSREKLVCRL